VRHFDFIDALRAMAILGVMTVHTAQWVPPSSETLRAITAEGARGVQLFFVASALTIFMSMQARFASEANPVRNFYIRRFFRIAPLFYLAIIIWLFFQGFSARYWAPNGINGWTVFLTATFLHGFHPETITALVPGGWSIAVEMTFYLLAPLLFFRLNDPKKILFLLAICLIFNPFISIVVKSYFLNFYSEKNKYIADNYIFIYFLSQIPSFLIGIVCLKLINTNQNKKTLHSYAFLIITLLIWIAVFHFKISNRFLPQHIIYSISFIPLIWAISSNRIRFLVNPLICTLGKISFSLYIFHFIVLHLLQTDVFPDGFLIQGNLGFVAALLLVVLISTMVSLLSYRYIERPGVAVGNALINRLERHHKPHNSL
jgi:peptidoglycan/LPS O-acetylase OafA/YrhL